MENQFNRTINKYDGEIKIIINLLTEMYTFNRKITTVTCTY